MAVLLIGGFLFSRGPGQLEAWRTAGDVLLLVGFVVQLLYGWFHRHSLAFYLLVERVRVRFSRRSAVWDVMVRYSVPWAHGGKGILENVDTAVRSVAGEQARAQTTGTWQRVYEWRRTGIDLDLTIHPPEGVIPSADPPKVAVYLHVRNLRVSFADSQAVLTHRIMPLLESIEDGIRPDDRAYTLTASFDAGQNPYLGLLLRWFPPEYIERFEAGLRLLPADGAPSAGSVRIERDQLSVTSEARRPFEKAALQCLTLSLAPSPAAR